MANTVKVSNISSKATIKEIEEFFSFSGQIESINLNSDEDESQTAYVTFMGPDSVKIALLLSGSAILDKEVAVSPCPNSATEASTLEPATDPLEAGRSISIQTSPRAINRTQEIVRSMLSRGFSLGKDAMRRANSLDEESKNKTDGDALEDLSNGSLDHQKSKDFKLGDDAHIAQDIASKSNESKYRDRQIDDVNDNACDNRSATKGDNGNKDGHEGVQQAVQGGRQGKEGINNVRMSMQKCYKHVCAINEKLQLGQRTLSALATAQQGVAHAGSAVANNKFVSAGGVWVSGALSRVSLRNPSASPHLNHDVGEGSPSQRHEHVQLTEMTTLSAGYKGEHD